jgi:hypothetical protein
LAKHAELHRQLGLGSAAALVVGEVIGVGIFLTPAGMARVLGSPLGLLLVWLALGAVTLAGALCLGELTARHPEAGGLYVYLRQAYGPPAAFLFGWMALLVMDPGLTAALATGLAGSAGRTILRTVRKLRRYSAQACRMLISPARDAAADLGPQFHVGEHSCLPWSGSRATLSLAGGGWERCTSWSARRCTS